MIIHNYTNDQLIIQLSNREINTIYQTLKASKTKIIWNNLKCLIKNAYGFLTITNNHLFSKIIIQQKKRKIKIFF